MPMTPKLHTINGLATELGVDRRTVAAKLADIPPDGTVQGHSAWRMKSAVAAVVAPAADDSPSLSKARAKLAEAQEELTRLKIDRERGDLLPADEVVAGWQAAVGRTRSLLLGIPPAAATTLVMLAQGQGQQDAERAIREDLTRRIDGALAELQNTVLDAEDDDDEPTEAQPAEQGSAH